MSVGNHLVDSDPAASHVADRQSGAQKERHRKRERNIKEGGKIMAFGEDFIRGLGELGLLVTIMVFLTPEEQKRKEKISKEITDYVRTLEEAGLSVTVVEINLTPEEAKWRDQVNKDVTRYVMEIEEAHKKAAHSKLFFGEQIRGAELSSVPY